MNHDKLLLVRDSNGNVILTGTIPHEEWRRDDLDWHRIIQHLCHREFGTARNIIGAEVYDFYKVMDTSDLVSSVKLCSPPAIIAFAPNPVITEDNACPQLIPREEFLLKRKRNLAAIIEWHTRHGLPVYLDWVAEFNSRTEERDKLFDDEKKGE